MATVIDDSRCLEGQQVTVRGSLYENFIVYADEDTTIEKACILAQNILIMPGAKLVVKNSLLDCKNLVVFGSLENENMVVHITGKLFYEYKGTFSDLEKIMEFTIEEKTKVYPQLKKAKN